MTESNAAVAELLEASASGFAAAAAGALLAEDETIGARYGAGAMSSWKAHFSQRLVELAAAVRAGEPSLFAERILWQQKAFAARGSDPEDLRHGLSSLKRSLAAELPEELRHVVEEYIENGISALRDGYEPEPSLLDPENAAGALALKYLAACLQGEPRSAIDLVLQAARDGMPIRSIYLHVLTPALGEVGRMWHVGEANIAEERVVTETTRRAMTLLNHQHEAAEPLGKKVLAAAVAGNAHDIGIRLVADFFEMEGWQAISLGANVPATDIASAAQFFDVDLVVLATTLTAQLKELQATVKAIRTARGDEVKILVGGLAFAQAPDLWRNVGADGYAAGAEEAVSVGGALIGLSRSG